LRSFRDTAGDLGQALSVIPAWVAEKAERILVLHVLVADVGVGVLPRRVDTAARGALVLAVVAPG